MKKNQKNIVGFKTLFDEQGAEFDVTIVETDTAKDFNFKKIYLYELLMATDKLTNIKTKIALMILEMADTNNVIVLPTQKTLASLLKISRTTLSETLKLLIDYNVICKIKNFQNSFIINPNIVCKANAEGRVAILKIYNLHTEKDQLTTQVGYKKIKNFQPLKTDKEIAVDPMIQGQLDLGSLDELE